MHELFRDDPRRRKGCKQKPVKLFVEELEGRCLLSHTINPISGIATAPDGDIWFLEPDRLGRIDPNSGVAQEFAIGTSISNSTGYDPAPLVAAPDGTLWFYSGNQVARFDPAANSLKEFSVPASLMHFSLALGPDGNAWVEETRGDTWELVRINPGTGVIQEFAIPRIQFRMGPIAVGGDGRVWAAVDFTLSGWMSYVVLDPNTGEVQKSASEFPLDTISTGPDGSIWLMGRSVWGNESQLPPWPPAPVENLDLSAVGQELTQKYHQQFLSVAVDGPHVQDKYGRIWSEGYTLKAGMAGPSTAGLADFDPATGNVEYYQLPTWGIWGITPDANGDIWFTSNSRIQPFVGEFDPNTGLFKTFLEAAEAAPPGNPSPAAGTTIGATAGIDFVTAIATFTPQTPVPVSEAAYQATIDWGDGTTSSVVLTVTDNGTYDVTAGHTYQAAGTYNIKVTIGNYDPANPLGDNPVTVFSTANVSDPSNINL
jgi:streptogramin lyase